ncbi:MAG TPA: hypothetical protein VLY63_10730 [Anaerolineae bacterium]|nr:hypothetical protein [Anaerolineae bacterium]
MDLERLLHWSLSNINAGLGSAEFKQAVSQSSAQLDELDQLSEYNVLLRSSGEGIAADLAARFGRLVTNARSGNPAC